MLFGKPVRRALLLLIGMVTVSAILFASAKTKPPLAFLDEFDPKVITLPDVPGSGPGKLKIRQFVAPLSLVQTVLARELPKQGWFRDTNPVIAAEAWRSRDTKSCCFLIKGKPELFVNRREDLRPGVTCYLLSYENSEAETLLYRLKTALRL